MKCDRRWYNDGRLEREHEAALNRDRLPAEEEERVARELLSAWWGWDYDKVVRDARVTVERNKAGGYNVSVMRGVMRIALPRE